MSNARKHDLQPKFEGVRSYYGKARVYQSGTTKELVSYATTVAKVIDGVAYRGHGAPQSATTARHMREFFQQEGFDKMMMSDLRALPIF
jgi:hypothetical protein